MSDIADIADIIDAIRSAQIDANLNRVPVFLVAGPNGGLLAQHTPTTRNIEVIHPQPRETHHD
jgi:hypothetical protein